MNLDDLNAMSPSTAATRLMTCCGSTRWAGAMADARPFHDTAELRDNAELIWWGLDRSDWLEAFAAHPKIGDLDALESRYAANSAEQAGVADAPYNLLHRLADANQWYEDRFGYIFIICATGKTAGEMLDLLERRLGNDPETEIQVAAAEQASITRLRLERLVS